MGEITIKLNGIKTTVPEGIPILEAAAMSHIRIPTLCYMKDLNEIGACRICVVEVKGAKTLVASCVYPVSDGMEVWTNTPRVRESRKKTLQLILSNHRKDCLACVRNGSCSSSVRSSALPMKTITMVSAPRPSSMTAPFT